MKYFIQLYNDRFFTKASKKLYISQQYLSRIIKNIENELGVLLFDRTMNGVEPTIEGKITYYKFLKIINEYEELLESCKNSRDSNGIVNIKFGIANIALMEKASDAIENFLENYKDVSIDLVDMSCLACEDSISNNFADFCLSIFRNDLNEYEYIPVSFFKPILIMSKKNSLSKLNYIEVRDLDKEKFIELNSDLYIKQVFKDKCIDLGFQPRVLLSTSRIDLIIKMVQENRGIAFLPDFLVNDLNKYNHVIEMKYVHEMDFNINYGFMFLKGKKLHTRSREFIDYFIQAINLI